MTLLATLFREKMKETKDITQMSEMTYSVSYGTGFLPLDYATGYIQKTDVGYTYELGISDGSINTLIGYSGTGKTSLLIAIACHIAKQFEHSAIFMDQAEVGTNITRLKNLSGFDSLEDFKKRFIVRDAGITTESIYRRVKAIHDLKVQNSKTYLYDTGIRDKAGKPIMKFEPTIYIVDSLKLVQSEKNSEADETNNMTMVPLCRMANIIMILVNHITPKVSTTHYQEKSEFPYLNQNEHLSNGKLLQYISNLMIKLDIKAKLELSDNKNPFGISGTIVGLDMIKSRTSKSGRARCLLVYDQDIGFDADLSMFLMLKDNNILEGKGRYKLPNSDIRFTAKNFKQTLYSNPDFYNEFNTFCVNYIANLLAIDYERVQEQNKLINEGKTSYDIITKQFSSMTTLPEPMITNKSDDEMDDYDIYSQMNNDTDITNILNL